MYPLRFDPIFRRYIWGGNRLRSLLNKPTGHENCAESWEIADHGDDQSVIRYGKLKGRTLHSIMQEQGSQLLGERWWAKINNPQIPANLRGRFPLLLKFLDAAQNLSVQVHPDDAMGAQLQPPDLGKTEAWFVLHAEPDAKIYAGLKAGVTRDDLRRAIHQGTTETALHSFTPSRGDCVYIAAGTLHAIGAGLVLAEIQQASDTTFRVYDWNRVDEAGQARELHIEQSLQAINFNLGPVFPQIPEEHDDERIKTIVHCDKFVMRAWSTAEPVQLPDGQLRLLAMTRGQMDISGDPGKLPLCFAETALVPHGFHPLTLTPSGPVEFLEIVLP